MVRNNVKRGEQIKMRTRGNSLNDALHDFFDELLKDQFVNPSTANVEFLW